MKSSTKMARVISWVVAAFLLSGCALSISAVPQSISNDPVPLRSGRSVGQTFVAQNGGLNSVEFYLEPGDDLSGLIRIHLRSDAESTEDITSSSMGISEINGAGFYRFEFQPQADSFRKYYYVFLEFEGEGTLWIGTAPGYEYLDGALYLDHIPDNQQSVFNLTYHPGLALKDFAREILYWCLILIAAVFLFVIPGLAIESLVLPTSKEWGWISKIVLGFGLSLCLYPILFLLTDLSGIRLGPILAWTPGIIGVLILVWRAFTQLKATNVLESLSSWRHSDNLLPDLTTVLVVAMIVGVRFFITRVVDLPLWGDSLTHSMVAQLLVDNQGLFQSWGPYAELQTFTYHFGFHTHTAVFHWITQIPVPQSTLWVGQIINIIAVLSLFPIAKKIGGTKWAGVVAILISGLVISMPNFYTNWGRYTQLAGQAILPSIILTAWALSRKKTVNLSTAILLGVMMGGLGLVHYRVLIFAIILIMVIILDQVIRDRSRYFLYNFSISTLIGLLIFLPWFATLVGGNLLGNAIGQVSTPASSVSNWTQQYNAVGELQVYLPWFIWLAMIVCALWGVIRKSRYAINVISWWLLLLLAANPQIINLPGQGALSNFAIFIAMFIPAGVLIGGAMGWLLSSISSLKRILPILIALAAIIGGMTRVGDLDPQKYALATRSDIQAWAWIENNTPTDAKFLTNSFFAYGGSLIVGSDGGWWLPLMTKRQSSLPPINYGTERGPRTDNLGWQNELVRQLQSGGIDDNRTLEMIRERGITHVYIGQQQGNVNSFGSIILNPNLLNASSLYKPIYNQDRVWIFEIVQ